jgi:hypothetical protein
MNGYKILKYPMTMFSSILIKDPIISRTQISNTSTIPSPHGCTTLNECRKNEHKKFKKITKDKLERHKEEYNYEMNIEGRGITKGTK